MREREGIFFCLLVFPIAQQRDRVWFHDSLVATMYWLSCAVLIDFMHCKKNASFTYTWYNCNFEAEKAKQWWDWQEKQTNKHCFMSQHVFLSLKILNCIILYTNRTKSKHCVCGIAWKRKSATRWHSSVDARSVGKDDKS